jgi:hypothetical protein
VACHRFGRAKQPERLNNPCSQPTVLGQAKAVASYRTPKCAAFGRCERRFQFIRDNTTHGFLAQESAFRFFLENPGS